MNIKETMSYLNFYGVNMTGHAIRQAAKRGQISDVEKDGRNYVFNKSSLNQFIISKKKGDSVAAYRLGFDYALSQIKENVITNPLSSRTNDAFLFAALHDNTFHYIVSNFHEGFNYFYVRYDEPNKILHVLDNLTESGTSAINLISELFIQDLLLKINGEASEKEVLATRVFIYTWESENKICSTPVINSYSFIKEKNKFDFSGYDKNLIYLPFLRSVEPDLN